MRESMVGKRGVGIGIRPFNGGIDGWMGYYNGLLDSYVGSLKERKRNGGMERLGAKCAKSWSMVDVGNSL